MQKLFSANEVLSSERFYLFRQRRKVVVFVPADHVEQLSLQMSKAGAGKIGDYEECSFRTEGVGTFKPGSSSTPYSGSKNVLSHEREIKLEMECPPDKVGKVLDALIKNHPYEEVAYEVYKFRKREADSSGIVLNLRTSITVSRIQEVTGFVPDGKSGYADFETDTLIVTDLEITREVIQSARFINVDCIISEKEKKIKII